MMIQFRTEIQTPKTTLSLSSIRYDTKILLMGSCFTENISKRLNDLAYDVVVNPTGIIYQSVGMMRVLRHILDDGFEYQTQDLFEYHGKSHSFDHHGSYSHIDQDLALARMNADLDLGRKQVQACDFLILTFGTSWGYGLSSESRQIGQIGQIVNNCHQLPGHCFDRRWLSLSEQWTDCCQTLDLFFEKNPRAHLILTVSPIRHMKDQLVENQKSKANLILLAHELVDKYQQKSSYFPAYEIMMDDLRDYRFYERDLIHPTELAVDYIWEKFEGTYLDLREKSLRQEIGQLRKRLKHRVLDEDAPDTLAFRGEIQAKLSKLFEKYTWLRDRLE